MKIDNYFLLLCAFIVLATSVNGQDESVFNIINGVKLEENIYLRWDNTIKSFRYASDEIDNWHNVDEDIVFNVRNNHNNNFKVFVEFYNPLRYTIKSETKDISDPAYQAINEFISQLPAMPEFSTEEKPSFAPSLTYDRADGNKSIKKFKESIILYEWMYQFTQVIDIESIKLTQENTDEFERLVSSINKIKQVDDYLFGNIQMIDPPGAYSINEWISNQTNALYDANNDYEKFNQRLETSDKIIKSLADKKENAEKAIEEIIEILSSKYDGRISPFIIKEDNNIDFKHYSKSTSIWLSVNHMEKMSSNRNSIEKFESLLKKMKEHKDKFKHKVCDKVGTCYYYFEETDIKLRWYSQDMKSFKYESKKLDINGNEIIDDYSTGSFIVGKRHILYPFVSTGILYTDFSYPNYTISTDNGINTVGETGDTKVDVRPALFLNLLIANWDPVYPYFQVGVATGVNDVIFPVGLGLSIGKSISISGGPMLGYRKELSSLKPGDIVKDETELKNDLTNKGFVSWYFSINYNISKK